MKNDNARQIMVVGGGATGVELAAELDKMRHELNEYGAVGIDVVHDTQLTILERAPARPTTKAVASSRRAPMPPTSRPASSPHRSRAIWPASRSSTTSTPIAARWSRSTTPPSAP